MSKFVDLVVRAVKLRCPVCGKGKLFRGVFKMYEYCPVCEYHYEREEGYFTSSMAINIVVSELAICLFTIPLAADPAIPMWPVLGFGAPFTVILPVLLFRHSRSLWMSMDLYAHPLERSLEDPWS